MVDLYSKIKSILVENFCEAGETDKDGLFRNTNIGNCLYLSTNKNGWCYSCASVKKNLFRKFSINADGSMRNEGKVSRVYITDIVKQAEKSTKYAVLTPMITHNFYQNGEFNVTKMLNWQDIDTLIEA